MFNYNLFYAYKTGKHYGPHAVRSRERNEEKNSQQKHGKCM